MTGKICGTGAYIPEKILDNEALSKLVDTSDEWIRSRTGIQKAPASPEKKKPWLSWRVRRRRRPFRTRS